MFKIGLVSVSDRAANGIYDDEGIPSLISWLQTALKTPFITENRIIPDEQIGRASCRERV